MRLEKWQKNNERTWKTNNEDRINLKVNVKIAETLEILEIISLS